MVASPFNLLFRHPLMLVVYHNKGPKVKIWGAVLRNAMRRKSSSPGKHFPKVHGTGRRNREMGTGHFRADCDSEALEEAERQLVLQAQAGEGEAFGELVRRYQRPVYRLAYRLLMHHADAEDVVQETFLRAYRYLQSFDPRRSFRRWLYAIAVRECHRLQQREGRLSVVELDESLPDPAWGSSPDRVYAHRELGAEIQRALLKLSWHQRTALILSAVEGLPSAEVAEVLGCSAPTARIHLFRARKNLRRALHGYLEGPDLARTPNEPDQAPAEG